MKLTWKLNSLGDWPALVETNIQCHLYILRGFKHNAYKDIEACIASNACWYSIFYVVHLIVKFYKLLQEVL